MFLAPEENYIGCLEHGGTLNHSQAEKENILFATYFEGEHLRNRDFDTAHYNNICRQVEEILSEDTNDEELDREVEPREVEDAIGRQDWSGKAPDGDGIHPRTLKHLGGRAVRFLAALFDLCWKKSSWPWRTSTVSFIKKAGKKSYTKPGSFRPITISNYIGKLFERVIDHRMRSFCYDKELLDEEQEGFLPTRNCTRYLYRLLSTLHENRRRKATAYLLLIDFEKAFDSIPLPCLIFKLHRLGIQGRLLKLLHTMLSVRKVKLKINGKVGQPRTCGTTGLPQGAVLSPLLFIIYISDLLTTRNLPSDVRHHTETYKFADDGSVLVTGTQEECERSMKKILQYIHEWCRQWRLVVNTDKDKTEIIVIQPKRSDPLISLTKLRMGRSEISYADSSKVLGVYLDKDLDFQQHATYTLKKCWYSWNKLSSETSRTAGLNSTTLSLLFKTVVLTKLFYAAPLWLEERLENFKAFVSRAKLKILGSQFFVPKVLADLLTTIPPLEVVLETLTIKFVLKGLSAMDGMSAKLYQIDVEPLHKFSHHLSMTKRFLDWAENKETDTATAGLRSIQISTRRRNSIGRSSLLAKDPDKFIYTKGEIDDYLFKLWDVVVINSMDSLMKVDQFTIEPLHTNEELRAIVNTKAISLAPLLNRSLSREESTSYLDFVHGHNLRFQNFAYSYLQYDSSVAVPTCLECGLLPDSPYHKIFECISVGGASRLRQDLNPISIYELNFRLPLIFCSDPNIKRKFRTLVSLVLESCSFEDNLLTS